MIRMSDVPTREIFNAGLKVLNNMCWLSFTDWEHLDNGKDYTEYKTDDGHTPMTLVVIEDRTRSTDKKTIYKWELHVHGSVRTVVLDSLYYDSKDYQNYIRHLCRFWLRQEQVNKLSTGMIHL